MLASIQILGLGPHTDTTIPLAPSGWTHVEGGSETGKSTITDALVFALTGQDAGGSAFPVDLIGDDAKRAEVILTTAKGARIGRTKTRSGSTTRTIDDASYTAEDAFAGRLGPVGRRLGSVPLARLVASPMSWVALADGEGGGRPLRDALVSLLPGDDRDTIRALMLAEGHELRDTDPTTPKAAEDLRRAANSAADAASGRLEQAKAALEQLPPPPPKPSEKDLAAARALVMDGATWRAFDDAAAKVAEAQRAHRASADAVRAWEARKEARGPRPDADLGALSTARRTLRAREDEVRAHTRDLRVLEEALADALAKVDADIAAEQAEYDKAARYVAEHEGAPGCCAACGQPWAGAEERLAEARALAEAAAKAVALLTEQAEARKADIIEAHRAQIAEVTTALREAEVDVDSLTGRVGTLERAVEAAARWDREFGSDLRLSLPALPEAPQEPSVPRPEAGELAAARALLSTLDAQAGAADQHARQAAKLREAVDARKVEHAKAKADAARCAALVEAIRRAPGERFAQLVEALGDAGPVTLHAPEGKAIEVRIDGRPWRRASEGRQVYADAMLRHAIRRLARAAYLPLVIDRMGAWSGDRPEIPGPVVALHTTSGALRVRA